MIHLTRSHLSDIARCERKYWYKHILELPDSASSLSMSEGTVLHRGLEAAYEVAKNKYAALSNEPLAAGLDAMRSMIADGFSLYHGKQQALNEHIGDAEVQERLFDVFAFYMEKAFKQSLEGRTVIATERPFTIELTPGVEVEGKIDLILQQDETGIYEVWDHKSVGNVNTSLKFLGLDVQMQTYEAMACEILRVENVEMVYNLIRRERPPGFGSRSDLTKSGRPSTASREVTDYLRQQRWTHNATERQHIRKALTLQLQRAYNLAYEGYIERDEHYLMRTPIKTGGEACSTSCAYNARCAAELLGYTEPVFAFKPAAMEEVGED